VKAGAPRALFGAVLVILVLVGSAAASQADVLTTVPVRQSSLEYQAGSGGANGYGAATIALSTVPGGVMACTSGTTTIPSTPGSATLVFSSVSGGTNCTAGDFSEQFTISFSATISLQTNTFAVTTATGGGVPGVNQEDVQVGTSGAPAPTVATVEIYIDYGSTVPPATGIALLDLAIT
jgi:hypothetical protein